MIPGDDLLTIGPYEFESRLFVGTGKYASHEQMRAAVEASGTQGVTVAVRRIDLGGEERDVTILFADIRSYSTISEALPAREIWLLIAIGAIGMAFCIVFAKEGFGGVWDPGSARRMRVRLWASAPEMPVLNVRCE